MPRFKKAIVKAGVYNVATPKGDRRVEVIPDERIKHWANVHTEMATKGTGFRIPAPWAHSFKKPDGSVFIPGPVQMGVGGALEDSTINAGFWEDLSAEIDPADGIMTLFGYVDAPGKEDDFNTPAGKIGKSVRETSIFANPVFEDGKGNKYEDVLMHVALVTHPIEPNQSNFVPVKDQVYELAMSHFAFKLGEPMQMAVEAPPKEGAEEIESEVTEEGNAPNEDGEEADPETTVNAGNVDLGDLLNQLRQSGINLPEDTNADNLVTYLKIAVAQKNFSGEEEGEGYGEKGEKKEKGNLNKPPKGAEQQSAGAFMATTEESLALVMSHPVVTGLQAANKGLLTHIEATEKRNRMNRVNRLVATGVCTKEHAEAKLVPLVNAFQMSFDAKTNAPVPQAIDTVLETLEGVTPPKAEKIGNNIQPGFEHLASFMAVQMPDGSYSPAHPMPGFHNNGALDNAQCVSVVDDLVGGYVR